MLIAHCGRLDANAERRLLDDGATWVTDFAPHHAAIARADAVITHGGIISTMLAGFGLPKIPVQQLQCDFGEGYDIHVTADLWQRSQAFEILGMTPYQA